MISSNISSQDRRRVALRLKRGLRRRITFKKQPPEYYLISFPKSGRTWLRFMIGIAIANRFKLSVTDPTDLSHLYRESFRVPLIEVTHDSDAYLKTADEITFNATLYERQKVVFLARDPRDILVSLYFQSRYRRRFDHPKLPMFKNPDELVYSSRAGLNSIIRFYNIWCENRHVLSEILFLTYEDITENQQKELIRCLDFLKLSSSQRLVSEVVRRSSFDNMQQLEQQGISGRLTPGDPDHDESYKVRRGKIGTFREYLSPSAISVANRIIDTTLAPFWARYFSSEL